MRETTRYLSAQQTTTEPVIGDTIGGMLAESERAADAVRQTRIAERLYIVERASRRKALMKILPAVMS